MSQETYRIFHAADLYRLDKMADVIGELRERRSFLQQVLHHSQPLGEQIVQELQDWNLSKIESWIKAKRAISSKNDVADILSAVCEIGNRENILAERYGLGRI